MMMMMAGSNRLGGHSPPHLIATLGTYAADNQTDLITVGAIYYVSREGRFIIKLAPAAAGDVRKSIACKNSIN